jgi:hypothetical protein
LHRATNTPRMPKTITMFHDRSFPFKANIEFMRRRQMYSGS